VGIQENYSNKDFGAGRGGIWLKVHNYFSIQFFSNKVFWSRFFSFNVSSNKFLYDVWNENDKQKWCYTKVQDVIKIHIFCFKNPLFYVCCIFIAYNYYVCILIQVYNLKPFEKMSHAFTKCLNCNSINLMQTTMQCKKCSTLACNYPTIWTRKITSPKVFN